MISTSRPNIGLTMGDAAGVGPELVLRALQSEELTTSFELTVFGDLDILAMQAERLGVAMPDVHVITPNTYASGVVGRGAQSGITPTVVDFKQIDLDHFVPCQISSQCGHAAYTYIQAAMDAALAGRLDAVTTCPIHKSALQAAGHNYPGHTEMFAERCAVSEYPERWCMMQYSDRITCTFVTVHVGYAEVSKLIRKQRVLDVIELTHEALLPIVGDRPKLLVCGLNPHAGEGGLFGEREEERAIIPAIEIARERGLAVEGPVPGDTAFLPWRLEEFDAIVCMYHDQGHIPVKTLAFDRAVNTSLGLRIVRTSVDHGTAFDIAWGSGASTRPPNPHSLLEAIRLAGKLSSTVKAKSHAKVHYQND